MHRVVRDGAGGSTIVERFDLLTQVLACWLHGGGAPSSGAELRARFRELARRRPALFPGRYAALRADDGTLDRLVAILADEHLPRRGDLVGVAYEEVIRGTFDKGDHQQFFTPRPVVRFMVELVADRLRGRVCDPACGTGGFLLGALARARADGRGPALCPVGLEVDGRLAWTAAVNLALHGVDEPDVRHLPGAGSLGPLPADLAGGVDVVLTNPPFGSDLSDPAALAGLELGRGRPSRRRGVLFVERCLDLVRPGGTVAIVIDDAALNGAANRDLRRLVLERAAVEAVVALPEVAFMPYATVRSSILLLRRRGPGGGAPGRKGEETLFGRAGQVGRRSSGEVRLRLHPGSGRLEIDDDLPAIAEAFVARRRGREPAGADPEVEVFAARLPGADDPAFLEQGLRLDVAFHHPARRRARAVLERSPWPLAPVGDLCDLRRETVVPARACPDDELLYLGLADIEARSGRCTPRPVIGEQVRSGSLRVRPGDVLFARMRPELRKVCVAPDAPAPMVASAECLVLVPRRKEGGEPAVAPRLLSLLLRSDLTRGQLVHLVTGIGRPRVSRSAVLAVRLPVPPLPVQRRLLRRFDAAVADARELRRRSRSLAADADRVESGARDELIRGLLEGADPPRPAR